MASSSAIKILQVCEVSPATNSDDSGKGLSFPLTFLDTWLLKSPQTERIYFYNLTGLSSNFFHSFLLPKLKLSLSHTLLHFLPLAGHLTWTPDSPKPIIQYAPKDAVSLTVAESSFDFDILVSNEIREGAELRPYLPELSMSDTSVSIISLQITVFCSKGFSIGIAMHHSALDGKSASMFMKSWAHICKNTQNGNIVPNLLPELIPFFDRRVIRDPDQLDSYFLNHWVATTGRSLKLLQKVSTLPTNLVRATFEISPERINNIRDRVVHYYHNQPLQLHLSRFVVTCAYFTVCLVKARGGDSKRMVCFITAADCRRRLEPPIPENYFGNCIFAHDIIAEAETFMNENGIAKAAKKISDSVKGLERGVFEGVRERHVRFQSVEEMQTIAVIGSPIFSYYKEDFGWGKPEKVEVSSIDRIKVTGISVKENRDGNGGVEVGLILPTHEMEAFALMFDTLLNV